MNNNFTHKEFKNFTPKVSDFLSILTNLPAGPWFAVNFLFVPSYLIKLPAISKLLRGNKQEMKLKPVFVIDELCKYKRAY